MNWNLTKPGVHRLSVRRDFSCFSPGLVTGDACGYLHPHPHSCVHVGSFRQTQLQSEAIASLRGVLRPIPSRKHARQQREGIWSSRQGEHLHGPRVQLSCVPPLHRRNRWDRRSRSFCDTSVKVWPNDSWWHFLTQSGLSKMWGDVPVNIVLQKWEASRENCSGLPTAYRYRLLNYYITILDGGSLGKKKKKFAALLSFYLFSSSCSG